MSFDYRRYVSDVLHRTIRAVFPENPVDADVILSLVEIPKEKTRGDLAFPCFQLAKIARKGPPQIATMLAGALTQTTDSLSVISEVEAIGPYLNFNLNQAAIAGAIIPQIQEGSFVAPRKVDGSDGAQNSFHAESSSPSKRRVTMVEYSQPNSHKVFHVGHCRNAALGDSVARIIEWNGDRVIRANYYGDEGTHVAGCLWYLKKFNPPFPDSHLGEFIGACYEKAYIMKDLRTYSKVNMIGPKTAKVLTVNEHPTKSDWTLLTIETIDGAKQVVTAAKETVAGDVVFHVAPGLRLPGRVIEEKDLQGVSSFGVVLSEKELGLSENNDLLAKAPIGSALGIEAADIFSIRPDIPSVVQHVQDIQKEISDILQGLERHEGELEALWKQTRQYSFEEFDRIYEWLNCKFDHIYTESQFGAASKELVIDYLERGVFVRSEGAIGADLKSDNLGFCLLLKRDGTATYAARDLALSKQKFADYPLTRLLNVVDFAQTFHFQQVFRCLELMGFEQAKNCRHLSYQLVLGPDGKMSSRKGNTVPFSELKHQLREEIGREYLEKYRGEWSDEELELGKDLLARATIRYGMLKESSDTEIVFKLSDWIARTGNTGPYLLYAYARTRSILREVISREPSVIASDAPVNWDLLSDDSEHEVILLLARYRQVVEEAAERFAPNELCAYLFELARSFSRMYERCSVLYAPDTELRRARTSLVYAVGTVLQSGLSLLGIDTLERM